MADQTFRGGALSGVPADGRAGDAVPSPRAEPAGPAAGTASAGSPDDDTTIPAGGLRPAGSSPTAAGSPVFATAESSAAAARRIPSAPGIGVSFPSAWGRFELTELLGQGGMGRVFAAWDPALKRSVALKVLLGTGPVDVGRFVREARAQARVDHPAVCKVYEVGEIEGVPFIAMQLVRGPSLRELALETVAEKVELMRVAAEGLHAAHRTGLIHRDLKPANILVERTEDGRLLPYLVDFGLAQVPGEASLTLEFQVTGTPSYMSPEQARGEVRQLDRRSDVYGFGATLYELLTGRPPAAGATPVDVMLEVVEKEPVPPSALVPGLPRDLETIVLKCLAKDPDRRYDSARAVAEDLERLLDGEPILGRRPGLVERLVRRTRKHKVATTIAAASLLVAVAAAGLGLRERWTAAEEVRLAQLLGREVAGIEAEIRHARMLPRHDVTADEEAVRARMRTLESRVAGLGPRASAAGRYALGRAALALLDWDLAAEHLDAAWRAGLREPSVAWALGQVYGRRYEKAAEAARRVRAAPVREQRLAEAERLYREPAARFLVASLGAAVEVPEYLEAVLALYDRQEERALERAGAALGKAPWLWEALHLSARVHLASASRAQLSGRYEDALATLSAAETILARGLEIARSAAPLYEEACAAASLRLRVLLDAGRDVAAAFPAAEETCRTAIAVAPGRFRAWERLGAAQGALAEYQLPRGLDPREACRGQVEAARRAAALSGREVYPRVLEGFGWSLLAEHQMRKGEDPRESLRAALTALDAALALDPTDAPAVLNSGLVASHLASFERDRGADPMPNYRLAIERNRAAAAASPLWVMPHSNLGVVLVEVAQVSMDRGADPFPLLAEAVSSLERSLAINPNDRRALNNLGWAFRVRADAVAARGGDPAPDYARAEESLLRAAAADPRHPLAWVNLGELERRRAEHASLTGRDPRPACAKGLSHFQKAAALDPTYADAPYGLGEIHRVLAEHAVASGQSPDAETESALPHLMRALALKPDLNGALWETGRVHLVAARGERDRPREAEAALTRAARALDEAIAGNPRAFDAARLRGEVELERVALAVAARRDAGRSLAEAGRWIGVARELGPRDPDVLLAHARHALATARLGEGEVRRRAAGEAKATLDKLLAENRHLAPRCRPLIDEAAALSP